MIKSSVSHRVFWLFFFALVSVFSTQSLQAQSQGETEAQAPKPAHASAGAQEQKQFIAHGRIPSDPEYWQYNKWYRSHAVLDVVVNGTQPSHLEDVLKELERLKQRGVFIRDLVVIGGNSFSVLDQSSREQYSKNETLRKYGGQALKNLKLAPSMLRSAEALKLGEGRTASGVLDQLKSLEVQVSPLWIVTYRGKQHLFEGVDTMIKHFSRSGAFSVGAAQ